VNTAFEIKEVKTSPDKALYLSFLYSIYAKNPNFKDVQVHIARSFLRGGDCFIRTCHIRPILMQHQGQTVAECMYVSHPGFPALQVSFLECREEHTWAIDQILAEARHEALRRGLSRIVVGLNGHVSYGVGFLANQHDLPISFDSLYSAPWLVQHLDQIPFLTAHGLSTWSIPMDCVPAHAPVLNRHLQGYEIRPMNMRNFRAEMLRFGELANRCLAETLWYFPKAPQAMYEILKEIRWFLRPEHLLFAMKNNREVGFHFWHPDFNEVLPGGTRTSLVGIALRCLLRRSHIRTFKLNAIGLLPEVRNTTLLAGLLNETYRYTGKRFNSGETNFVWDSNSQSRLLNFNKMGRRERIYRAFEFSL